MTMTAQSRETGGVFDDVFRTMLERLERLMIPVINEVFHTQYSMTEMITQLKNEHVTDKIRLVTDSHLQIGCIAIANHQYHVECESRPSGRISIRMVEYDFAIAVENVSQQDNVTRIHFPNSCILYLRQARTTKDKKTLYMEFADGTSAKYTVPIVQIQKYTKEEIFGKKLYFLFPFYIIRYERSLEKMEESEAAMKKFLEEFEEIIDRLRGSSDLNDTEYSYLLDCIHRVANHILRKTPLLKERIDCIMGGKVLRLRTDEIIEQGLQQGLTQGLKQGLKQGELNAYVGLIKDGLLSLATAAKRLGMSEDELNKHIS